MVKVPRVVKSKAQKAARSILRSSRAASPAEKAAYHTITGAGRSHVRRDFFGLSASDEVAIVERLDQQIAKALGPS